MKRGNYFFHFFSYHLTILRTHFLGKGECSDGYCGRLYLICFLYFRLLFLFLLQGVSLSTCKECLIFSFSSLAVCERMPNQSHPFTTSMTFGSYVTTEDNFD